MSFAGTVILVKTMCGFRFCLGSLKHQSRVFPRQGRARPHACAGATRGVDGCAGLAAGWAKLAAGALSQLKHMWGEEEGWGVSWHAACCQRGTHHVAVCVLFGGVFSSVVVINSISQLGERAQKVLREV